MREIKFRAWDKLKNEWMEPPIIDGNNGKAMGFSPLDGSFVRTFSDDEVELVEYTGLKDKNGREIYEGDLYKYTISHDMYNPELGHTTFEIERVEAITFENGAFYHGNDLLADVIEHDDSFTYIGNIYENPELLEVSV
ncbi:YopX family protein [Lysinibacillus telephonicus]|uniref:YopX family protein n=1 Tax=Lysinibacillus telephonicus TaxID=1714840 RepID=UPI0037D18DA2